MEQTGTKKETTILSKNVLKWNGSIGIVKVMRETKRNNLNNKIIKNRIETISNDKWIEQLFIKKNEVNSQTDMYKVIQL